MRIVLAPDSFKGNMRSPEVCEILAVGLLQEWPEITIQSIPMADGGEGTTDAAVAATGGRLCPVDTVDPLGRSIEAKFGILGDGQHAVLEMAAASGIELLTKDELNPLKTTTFGTGLLIRAALDQGVEEIILGIGGSATTDGGLGMAQALGATFKDHAGRILEHPLTGGDMAAIHEMNLAEMDPRVRKVRFRVACDVTNPLLGENGAAQVYGPQKGATSEVVGQLEAGMTHIASIWKDLGLASDVEQPGDGAAGGLGAGLRVLCGATMERGAELMAEIAGLDQALNVADLLITGEGCTDGQTLSGKLCAVLAQKARAKGVPCILLSGALKGNKSCLLTLFDGAFSIATGQLSLEQTLAESRDDLALTARNLGRLLKLQID